MSHDPAPGPRVLLVCSDLFFATQLRAAAERSGAAVDLELQARQATERAAGGEYRLIVLDLESAGLDVEALAARLPAEQRPVILAFAPHVQTARLSAARRAGCDSVVPRSQAADTLVRLLGELR